MDTIEVKAVLEFLLFTEVLLCLAVGFCAYHMSTKCFFKVSILQETNRCVTLGISVGKALQIMNLSPFLGQGGRRKSWYCIWQWVFSCWL